ncbi:DUF551 domain-containing protein [Klebsiella pneumoniae]|uniref:DUF551 domain-containing protein n=1 Tax=Klebsiella pneumoniae TaxID=573 RepID=UPI000667B89B|nr:DUF551 domain-containing protein [Klebsiella pneumoniae]MCE0113092.1 DUF551 domain-containing protein [Klebsiella pneumoniae]UHL69811.1 DUF551 domain-containing protein [Klebsiella pneumoniae]WJT80352.1 DUF551 domain-containing protein [Klebsiella pneumoniae]HBY0272837.1 DUF551 domain-containing protein [Klebsiella pneumoniae]HBY1630606.1 DUF551 domain-containing protein [Klebsiella pneumoniae]
MINRNKLEHILEYAKQQRHIGQSCKVPPEDMVEIMERLLNAGNSPVIPDTWIPVSERMPESNGMYFGWDGKRVLEVYCFFGGFSANQFIHGEITHWMPLPADPQEVNHG